MFRIKYIAVAVLLSLTAPLGRANSVIADPGPGLISTAIDNTGVGVIAGFDFTVDQTLLVTALGMWDQSQNGFTNSHHVGLWDSTGNLLAQVQISPGTVDSLSGAFRYVSLATPVTLNAGMTYILGATYINFDLDRLILNKDGKQAIFDPLIMAGNFRQTVGVANLVAPTVVQSGSGVGPNAQFIAVPEAGPGVLLFAVVLGALFLVHRRIAAIV
ncbi:MAG TPA: DUF4082 domain-containing protein [Chthoniobacterales bacterium]|jgi:hypothetical protein